MYRKTLPNLNLYHRSKPNEDAVLLLKGQSLVSMTTFGPDKVSVYVRGDPI